MTTEISLKNKFFKTYSVSNYNYVSGIMTNVKYMFVYISVRSLFNMDCFAAENDDRL